MAFTAGFLATLVVEEIVPQAQEAITPRATTGVFVAGFAFSVLLSSFLT